MSKGYGQDAHPALCDSKARTGNHWNTWVLIKSEMMGEFQSRKKSNLHLALKRCWKWYPFDFSFPPHPDHTKSAGPITLCSFDRWGKESPEWLKHCPQIQQPRLEELGPESGSFQYPIILLKSGKPIIIFLIKIKKSKKVNHQSLSKSISGKVTVATFHFATA